MPRERWAVGRRSTGGPVRPTEPLLSTFGCPGGATFALQARPLGLFLPSHTAAMTAASRAGPSLRACICDAVDAVGAVDAIHARRHVRVSTRAVTSSRPAGQDSLVSHLFFSGRAKRFSRLQPPAPPKHLCRSTWPTRRVSRLKLLSPKFTAQRAGRVEAWPSAPGPCGGVRQCHGDQASLPPAICHLMRNPRWFTWLVHLAPVLSRMRPLGGVRCCEALCVLLLLQEP